MICGELSSWFVFQRFHWKGFGLQYAAFSYALSGWFNRVFFSGLIIIFYYYYFCLNAANFLEENERPNFQKYNQWKECLI